MAAVTRGKPAASTVTAVVLPSTGSCNVVVLLAKVEWWSLMCRIVKLSDFLLSPSEPPPQAAKAAAATLHKSPRSTGRILQAVIFYSLQSNALNAWASA
jgi:hypothetical protein